MAVQLDVTAAGAPGACRIATSSGIADLDEAACRLVMKNGHFLPALDAQGHARAGTFRRTVRWIVPATPEMETVTVAYPVPTDDTRCVVVRADRRQALPVLFCQQLAQHLRSTGVTDLTSATTALPRPLLPAPDL